MASPQVLGRPASHAAGLRRDAVVRVTALAAVGAAAFFLGVTSGFSLPVTVGFVVAGGLAWARIAAEQATIGRLSAGIGAEHRAARALSRTPVAVVAHGALLSERGGDADHVVVGPQLAVVETKYGRGRWTERGDGIFVGRNRLVRDPVAQANGRARALREFLAAVGLGHVRVDAVVCVSELDGVPFERRGVWVCAAADLPRVVASLPARLTERDVAAVAHRLAAQYRAS